MLAPRKLTGFRTRGPGIVESLAWTGFYLVAQVLAFGLFFAAFVTLAFGRWPANLNETVDLMLQIDFDRSFVPFGVTNLLCLFLIIPALRLRLGPTAREYLRCGPPRRNHLVLIAGAILPLAVVSEQLYRWSMSLWAAAASTWPALRPWTHANSVDTMLDFARHESYPVLVVAIALGPAIGEELVFRGLIGNGLTRRWGVRAGMIATSILFAAAPGFPPHALATIPIGLFLHHVYLSTGTVWAPILVHFLNNLLVISLARYDLVEDLPGSPLMVLCAAAYVWTTAAILHAPVLGLPVDSNRPNPLSVLWRQAPAARISVLAAGSVIAFTAVFVWNAVAGS
jgi:membrane protease YdiL (CAAX protease family)